MFVLGCTAAEPEDGRDDAFLSDGKSDSGGVQEGSPEALGILAVANTVSDEILRERPPDGVGLGDRAVDNLIYIRLGDDGLPGTADDGQLATLAELDAVPFIGPIAFAKLLAYARDHGYVDTSCPATCAPERVADADNPFSIAVDATHVYWTDEAVVKRRAKAGGEVEVVASNGWNSLVVDGTHVYWAYAFEKFLQRQSKGAGTIEDIATEQSAVHIALDATHVYWTTFTQGTVMRREIGATLGAVETIASGLTGPMEIALDGTHVYWTDWIDGTIKRRTKAPGATELIATDQDSVEALVTDATHLYWTTGDDEQGAVVRRSKTGGPIETVATGAGIGDLALDGGGIFWTSDFDGSATGIYGLGPTDGAPRLLAHDVGPIRLAIDADSIYFTAADPVHLRARSLGRVMRLPRCACGL
jgi:hypothetical protein